MDLTINFFVLYTSSYFSYNVHIVRPLPLAYRARTKCPVLSTHIGFKEGFMAVAQHCPTPVFVFVCFVALRPKSTAMVMEGGSVHLTTLFPGQVNQYFVQILLLVTDKEENDHRWDRAEIKLATPVSAGRLASVARHVNDCSTWPGTPVFDLCKT